MLYITGDIHIPTEDIQKLNSKRFSKQKNLCREDYVIICGDFGGIWNNSAEEKYWIKWLENKNFTTLFIDGNHENFDLLGDYPVISYKGGRAHKISDSIYHLMRGQVFSICGKRIFTMGGASSHDKEFRTEHKNWWSAEMPSGEEYEEARKNLLKNKNAVDIIITHCAPASIQESFFSEYEQNELTEFLEEIKQTCSYDKWYFGHYHTDCDVDTRHVALFNRIKQL